MFLEDGLMVFYKLKTNNFVLWPWVLPNVPDPQKSGRVSPWLFVKRAKTTSYLEENVPKSALGQPANNVRLCTKNTK
jgi:hypothetical protein